MGNITSQDVASFITALGELVKNLQEQQQPGSSVEELLQNQVLIFEAFNEVSESFDNYIQRLEFFFKLKGLDKNDFDTNEAKKNRFAKSAPYQFAWERTTTPKGPTTTEDIVLFTPGKPVSLDIPGELFGSSFNVLTGVSTTVGDYMINSAIRLQRLLESMRPFLRFVFGAKGFVIEGPTDKPIFSDPNSVKDSR